MKRILKAFVLFFAIASFLGCELDSGENFHFVNLRITDVVIPETFQINRVYTISVKYERYNGCVFFENFRVLSPEDTVREVVAIGTELDETECTQAIEEGVASFNFEVWYQGTYTFRFLNGFDENDEPIFLEYEVPVEEQ